MVLRSTARAIKLQAAANTQPTGPSGSVPFQTVSSEPASGVVQSGSFLRTDLDVQGRESNSTSESSQGFVDSHVACVCAPPTAAGGDQAPLSAPLPTPKGPPPTLDSGQFPNVCPGKHHSTKINADQVVVNAVCLEGGLRCHDGVLWALPHEWHVEKTQRLAKVNFERKKRLKF